MNLASSSGKPRSATLALRRGEVLGIAGLVGAGRTELLRTLFGLDSPKAGTLRIATVAGNPPYPSLEAALTKARTQSQAQSDRIRMLETSLGG